MREEIAEIAEELADETHRLVAKKLRDINALDEKIKRVESRLGHHVGAFKTDVIEVERMITETKNNLESQQDESITLLVGEIQDLKDQVNSLKVELKKLKEERALV